jgi:uncharacterized protein YjiS (DUF1127 family)
MTTITHRQVSSAGGILRVLPGYLGRIAGGVRGYLTRSRAEAQLEALDDRLLLDIGLKRSEIHQLVWGCSR